MSAESLSCPPAEAVHAWMPTSPCEPRCVDLPPAAGSLRVASRVLRLVGLLAALPAVTLLTPPSRRPAAQRRYAGIVMWACGIRVRVRDERYGGAARPARNRRGRNGSGVLVVAWHVGWADVVALTAAVDPIGFVARADLVDWPYVGRLARLMRVIPIHRERLRQLPEIVDTMTERLAAGELVGMFPEGTTWCGRARGRFRPALFQAAIDAGVAVQPVRLRYLNSDGTPSTAAGFVGVDGLLDSVRRVLRAKGVVAELVLLPVEAPGTDRFELAARCERALRGPEPLRIDEHATAVGTGATRTIVPNPVPLHSVPA
ncbi:lysophospholipid acyltransferase family protein [Nocardia stercoris]|uniref:1-acyl-sn-glycerol-3-phosphate acyltransferase n=1 Tax=Nocardia stercoris TaxID=2483361 RepID=A0A3M2LE76_9NOCA|nr:lysophospholipid acyltransferase family protein [Nocardia stercoris]RMI35831.1 1-acyl-sn-glycerol-3-phosphate acyltransferase [Nocardia stercoris]